MVRFWLIVTALALVAACGPAPPTPTPVASSTPSPSSSSRPASPVKVTIVEPADGAVIHGKSVHVVVAISGGAVVTQTTTHVVPTEGHVHVYLQNQLAYMDYTLVRDFPVVPGLTYVIRAEFVAADHFPFSPRDVTPDRFFRVAT